MSERRPANKTIQVTGDVVIGQYARDATDHFVKSKEVYRIAEETRLFRAPKPLQISQNAKLLQWEYLPGLRPIRSALPELSTVEQESVARKIGASLAALQNGMQLGGESFKPTNALSRISDRELRMQVGATIDCSAIKNVHGDYACANLFLDPENNVVVIDPEPNLYLFDAAAPFIQASVYTEVALFVQSLNSRPDFAKAMKQRIGDVGLQFLHGYENENGTRLDRRAVFGLASGIALLYRDYRRRDGTEDWIRRLQASRFRKQSAARLQAIALQQIPRTETSFGP